jgi:hypothetical protein
MCASVVFGGVLLAGSLFAGQTINVTLPHAVTVGSTTLPSGQYTLTTMEMSDGNEYFVVRGQNAPALTLQAQKIDADEADRTRVVFTRDGDTWHFDKLYIEGDSSAYEFGK